MKNLKAFIFDMDGVLLDTESICDQTWEVAAKEFGLKDSKSAIEQCRGTSKADTKIILKRFYGQDFDSDAYLARTSELFYEIENSKGINKMPFAKECLEALKSKFRVALASSTRMVAVSRQLTNAGLINYFETITTGDMVEHSKPDPQIYRMACASLGLKPEECVAIEDSPNGIKSAVGAGMRVIMIPDKIKPTLEIKEKCWKIFDSLNDVINLINE